MCYILEIKEMFGMDSNKTPSEIIAELCVEAGISKSELARRLEITPSQITRILNGDTKTISSDILIKLTKLFGVSADYLLGITDKKEIIKEKHTTRVPMLLMSSAFPLGRCIEFIESVLRPIERIYAGVVYLKKEKDLGQKSVD